MKHFVSLFTLLSLTLLLGCDKTGEDLPTTAKVSGMVEVDGKPMEGGEVRFSLPGVPPRSMPVSSGAFSGEVFIGKNQVEVVLEKDGPPHPMEPGKFLKVNTIDPKFWGSSTTLSADVPKEGKTDLKFQVTTGA